MHLEAQQTLLHTACSSLNALQHAHSLRVLTHWRQSSSSSINLESCLSLGKFGTSHRICIPCACIWHGGLSRVQASMPAVCLDESMRKAERQLQQACENSAADVKAKGCFNQTDQVHSHMCFPCTQLSDKCCIVVGSNRAATPHKPQQDRLPAHFYCCTCWHVTMPHNGMHSAWQHIPHGLT